MFKEGDRLINKFTGSVFIIKELNNGVYIGDYELEVGGIYQESAFPEHIIENSGIFITENKNKLSKRAKQLKELLDV